MTYTEISQRRYSVSPTPTTTMFRIETSVISAGELPKEHIFVYGITDSSDPTLDKFVHIASLAELQSLAVERDIALQQGSTYYLSPYLEMEFPDLETAVAASPTLSSRINDLVLAWITYRDEFDTSGEIAVYYPTAVSSEVESRVKTYEEAKEETTAAQDALTAAETSLASAELTLTQQQAILAIYIAQKSFCTDIVNSKYPTYISLVLDGNGESAAAYAYRTGTGSLEATMNAYCAETSAAVMSWTNAVAASQSAVNTARGEKIAAEILVDKAEQKEAEALAAVLEVCSDFDPSAP